MPSFAFLLIAVGVILVGLLGIGVFMLASRSRQPDSVDEFRTSLDALSNFGGAEARGRRKVRR